jgi:putative SOS response-associated peptidase YedK
MCGRFVSSSSADELAAYFGVDRVAQAVLEGQHEPDFNVAPTKDIYVIVEDEGARHLDSFFWGLVPSWAKDVKIGARMINARAETLAEKGAFKSSFAKRRCLVPADGFYEWKELGGEAKKVKKQPMFIARADGEPVAFAGLWSVWRGPAREHEPLRSATIITTTANSTVASIHGRMPAVLPESAWATWLDRDNDDLEALSALLGPAPDDLLSVRPVSTEVNNVRNNGPQLLAPAQSADDGV